MCSILCCLTKSTKEKDVSLEDYESSKTPAKVLPEQPFAAVAAAAAVADCGDHLDDEREESDIIADICEKEAAGIKIYKTVGSTTHKSDTNICQTTLIHDEQRPLPSTTVAEICESARTTSVRATYPVRVFVSEQDIDSPSLQLELLTESNRPEGGRTTDKNCDNLVVHISNLFRRIIRPAKWPTTASEETAGIELSTFDGKRRNRFGRQLFDRRGRVCRHSSASKALPAEKPELAEIPVKLPESVFYPDEENSSNNKEDLADGFGDLGGGQGDAYRIPNHVMYAPPSPGKHLLEPQVFPVYSWSVPVYRTRLEEGGVSFTFGSAAESGTSSGEQPSNSQVPNPTIFSTMGSCPSNPTPMEVDEPPISDGTLLNHLVQLTNTSPIDNQQMVQQLREDMQKQLELQMQLQQQFFQQEVEARLRQMETSSASEATPKEHVAFCEWTLVLRYPAEQKVSDRPMGVLGHEPLRNYELKRRTAEDQNTDVKSQPDPPSCPNPESKPESADFTFPQSSPQPDPAKTGSTTECPKSYPVKPEPALMCPQSKAVRSEPKPGNPDSEPLRSESVPFQCEPAPVCPQADPVKSEPVVTPLRETVKPEPVPDQSEPKHDPVQSEQASVCPLRDTVKSKPATVCPEPDIVASEPTQACPKPDPVKSEPVSVCPQPDSSNSEQPPICTRPNSMKSEPAIGSPNLQPNPAKSEPAQVCPNLDPVKSEPAQVYPKPDPVKSETAQVCTRPDPVKSEPAQACPKPDPVKSEPISVCPQPDSSKSEQPPICTRPNSMKSEPAIGSPNLQPNPVKSEPAQVCPNVDPVKSEPAQAYPKPDPVKSETAQVCTRPDAVKSEPAQACPKPDPVKSEPVSVCPQPDSSNSEQPPICTRPNSMKSEPAIGSPNLQPNPVKSEPAQVYPKLDPPKAEPAQACPQPDSVQSKPMQVFPQPDPVKSKPSQLCPKPDPATSGPAQVCPQSDHVKSERPLMSTRPNSMKSEPVIGSQKLKPDPVKTESEPLSTELQAVKFEHASQKSSKRFGHSNSCVPGSPPDSESQQPNTKKSERVSVSPKFVKEPTNQGIKHELSEQTIYLKKPKTNHVRIEKEYLDDSYDIF